MEPLTVQAQVLAAIRANPQTAEELQVSLGRNRASIGTALHVLKQRKLIEHSGRCRLTQAGRSAVEWRATEEPAPDATGERMGELPALRWRCK